MDSVAINHSTEPFNRFRAGPAAVHDLAADVRIAAASELPVLISGPRDPALRLARTIVDRDGHRDTARFIVCDATAGDVAPTFGAAAASRSAVLVVCEAHALSAAAQMMLMDLEVMRCGPGRRGIRRIISTSSAGLLDCVRQGTFDERLFYLLNAIHIVIPTA